MSNKDSRYTSLDMSIIGIVREIIERQLTAQEAWQLFDRRLHQHPYWQKLRKYEQAALVAKRHAHMDHIEMFHTTWSFRGPDGNWMPSSDAAEAWGGWDKLNDVQSGFVWTGTQSVWFSSSGD